MAPAAGKQAAFARTARGRIRPTVEQQAPPKVDSEAVGAPGNQCQPLRGLEEAAEAPGGYRLAADHEFWALQPVDKLEEDGKRLNAFPELTHLFVVLARCVQHVEKRESGASVPLEVLEALLDIANNCSDPSQTGRHCSCRQGRTVAQTLPRASLATTSSLIVRPTARALPVVVVPGQDRLQGLVDLLELAGGWLRKLTRRYCTPSSSMEVSQPAACSWSLSSHATSSTPSTRPVDWNLLAFFSGLSLLLAGRLVLVSARQHRRTSETAADTQRTPGTTPGNTRDNTREHQRTPETTPGNTRDNTGNTREHQDNTREHQEHQRQHREHQRTQGQHRGTPETTPGNTREHQRQHRGTPETTPGTQTPGTTPGNTRAQTPGNTRDNRHREHQGQHQEHQRQHGNTRDSSRQPPPYHDTRDTHPADRPTDRPTGRPTGPTDRPVWLALALAVIVRPHEHPFYGLKTNRGGVSRQDIQKALLEERWPASMVPTLSEQEASEAADDAAIDARKKAERASQADRRKSKMGKCEVCIKAWTLASIHHYCHKCYINVCSGCSELISRKRLCLHCKVGPKLAREEDVAQVLRFLQMLDVIAPFSHKHESLSAATPAPEPTEDSQAAARQPLPLLRQPSTDISSAEQLMIPSSVGERYSGVIFAPRDLGFGFGERLCAQRLAIYFGTHEFCFREVDQTRTGDKGAVRLVLDEQGRELFLHCNQFVSSQVCGGFEGLLVSLRVELRSRGAVLRLPRWGRAEESACVAHLLCQNCVLKGRGPVRDTSQASDEICKVLDEQAWATGREGLSVLWGLSRHDDVRGQHAKAG
eukprot:g9456.t1